MEYLIYQNDEQEGPFSLNVIQQMLRDGQITQDTLGWHDGMSDWATIGEIVSIEEPVVLRSESKSTKVEKKPDMKNVYLILLSIIVVLLGFTVYHQSNDNPSDYEYERSAEEPVLSSPAPSRTSKEESVAEQEKKAEQKLLDEAESILDAREKNNQEIERLLKNRNELNIATVKLIYAIRDSGAPDTKERLNDPKIQETINLIKKMGEDLHKFQ